MKKALQINGQLEQGDKPDPDVAPIPEKRFLELAPMPERPFLQVAPMPETRFLDVAQEPDMPNPEDLEQTEENPTDTKKVLIPLRNYQRCFAEDKSMWSIYRQIRSHTFPFPLFVKTVHNRIHYFVEISDRQMIEKAVLNITLEEKIKPYQNKLIHIHIKIPCGDLKILKLIIPKYFHYERFMKRVESALKGESDFPQIQLRSDKVKFVSTAINLLEEDYKRLLQIAKNSNLSVSNVVMAFLESYLEAEHRLVNNGPKK